MDGTHHKDDALKSFRRFNEVFASVPDESDMAHHYIATRAQCPGPERRAKLIVTIVKAEGLRNADDGLLKSLLDEEDVSDPYCICEIPGKPDTKIKTPVVWDNL